MLKSAALILSKCRTRCAVRQVTCIRNQSEERRPYSYSNRTLSFQEQYNLSINKPEEFWADKANILEWYKKPEKIYDANVSPFQKWFVKINFK